MQTAGQSFARHIPPHCRSFLLPFFGRSGIEFPKLEHIAASDRLVFPFVSDVQDIRWGGASCQLYLHSQFALAWLRIPDDPKSVG